MVKTISDIDDIKGLHNNCRQVGCFVSYGHEHLSDYHWIAWFMLFVLLLMYAVNPLLTGGFPYKRSTVRNFVVWLMFEWAVEQPVEIQVRKPVKLMLCCTVMEIVIPKLMILLARKGSLEWSFAGPVWRDSIAGGTPHKRSAWYFLSCLPERTAKRTVELPVGWNRMRCHCYVSFVNPTFHMVEHRDHYVAVILKV